MNSAPHSCPAGLGSWLHDSDIPVEYDPQFREFFIRMAINERLVMKYCPLCGGELPAPLRDDWFDRLWELGLDGPEDSRIPTRMLTDEWWLSEGL